MSAELGLKLQIARREPGAPIIIPAVVHWKVGHFGALVRESDGRFRLQDPTFRNLKYNELSGTTLIPRDYSGHQLLRVPKLGLRATPAVTLLDGRFRAQMDVEHYSKRYADAANISKLPAYTVLNASVRFKLTDRISFWAYGDNLTNAIGLTEGNPRAGELTSGQANDQLFIGRPIFGRNFRFAVDFAF
jgi:outer membrane receptor protein involved in Fe transport